MKPLYYAAMSRVSLDEQRKGISPQDQTRRIHEWAANQSQPFVLANYVGKDGNTYSAEFYEDYSGFEYERPEMDVIRELARLGIIDAIIVLRTDRFARDEAVFMLLERYFKKHNVRLFSVEEGEFTPGSVNRYVAAFQRARAEDTATTAKKMMQDARHAYLKAGVPQSQGHPLYGYFKQGKKRETHYVIHEDQAEIVRMIFHLYVHEDMTTHQIAKELNRLGIPSPAAAKGMKNKTLSGKWLEKTVSRVLRCSAYIGSLIGYQHITVDGKVVRTKEEEYVTISVPTIIEDINLWEQAQFKLEHRRNQWYQRRANKRREYLLSGLTFCTCGKGMTGSCSKKNGDNRYYYYSCNSEAKRVFFGGICYNRVVADDLEITVWDFVERLVTNPETTMALYREEQQAHEAMLAEKRQRLLAIEELLAENHEEQNRLNWMFQKRRCDEDYFEAEWERLKGDRVALSKELEKVTRVLEYNTASAQQLLELETIGRELREATEEITFERKRRLLERLRLVITLEVGRTRDERNLTIEILGHASEVRLKRQTPS
jgi:site-specific DNA recombinase